MCAGSLASVLEMSGIMPSHPHTQYPEAVALTAPGRSATFSLSMTAGYCPNAESRTGEPVEMRGRSASPASYPRSKSSHSA